MILRPLNEGVNVPVPCPLTLVLSIFADKGSPDADGASTSASEDEVLATEEIYKLRLLALKKVSARLNLSRLCPLDCEI